MPRLRLRTPFWPIAPVLHAAAYAVWAPPTDATAGSIAATFWLLGAFASFALFTDKRPYSLARMFWLFVAVFFAWVPSYQHAVQGFPWGADISDGTVLRTNLLLLGCAVVFRLTTLAADVAFAGKVPRIRGRATEGFRRAHRTWGLALFLAIATVYLASVGITRFWLKGAIDTHLFYRLSEPVYLVLEKAVRGPVLYYTLASVALFRLSRLSRDGLMAVLAVFIIVNFPLALPRYLLASCYAGLLLSLATVFWIRRRQAFTLVLIGLLAVVFPVLSVARWEPARTREKASAGLTLISGSFTRGDYDAYAQTARTVDYVARHGHTGGRQLLTALAFAVPRRVWPHKSIGSGALVAQAAGKSFTNVSSPLPAEGLINFGPVGALLACALAALGAHRWDALYWHWRLRRAADGDLNFPVLFYPAALMLGFFLLRGDLLSSLAAGVGMYAAGYFFHALLRVLSPRAYKGI